MHASSYNDYCATYDDYCADYMNTCSADHINDFTFNHSNNNMTDKSNHSFALNTSHLCTWHKRLGHAPYIVLQHINSPDISSTITNKTKLQACDICHKAKQTRLPFPISTSITSAKFELIHADVWGPYSEPSLSGTNYMLTLVDDYTRVTWVYLLHHKSQVATTFSTFINMIQNQFETKVKKIRIDNGSEFVNNYFFTLLNKHGILHQRSTPYTPQQNGKVERKHIHLLQLVRSLMLQAALPKHLWPFSLLTATHIVNRLPTPILNWKSPYEMLYGKQPNYSLLKVFGCLCYAANTRPLKGKFDSRAQKCVFIGFSPGQKAYKLYRTDSKQIFMSCDVIFYEDLYPFQTTNHDNNSITLLVPTTYDIGIISENEHVEPSTIRPRDLTNNQDIGNTGTIVSERHSTRQRRPPEWLKDFVTNSITTNDNKEYSSVVTTSNGYTPNTFPYSISKYLNRAYVNFLTNISSEYEPNTYDQARKNDEWIKAMQLETDALEKNETWTLTELPPDKVAIGNKWVFKVKRKPYGSIDRYKARLVAKGFHQVKGIDYTESFSPVAKLVTVRVLLTVATARNWPIHQIDTNNAFLHGFIGEEVYMVPPQGYSKAKSDQVCKLRKSLYGLKQAGRQWNMELCCKLQDFGFI